jgi:hypothetical protein
MSGIKTRPTRASPAAFFGSIADPVRRRQCRLVSGMMAEATGCRPVMWGQSIVGFGSYHYVYASGREGDWLLTGFSPRKSDLVVYLMDGFGNHAGLLAALGRHKRGKSCLYLRNLDEVDLKVLKRLITASVRNMRRKYPQSVPARRRTAASSTKK